MCSFFITLFLHKEPADDDYMDRINRKYTVQGLVILAIISASLLAPHDISSLMSCWNKANYPKYYIDYTNHICFIKSSYVLDSNQTIPYSTQARLSSLFFFSLYFPRIRINSIEIQKKQRLFVISFCVCRRNRVLNYYQWTPFIILLMALFFYFPRLLWRSLSVRSGIDLLDLIEAAGETKTVQDFDDRDQLIKYIVDTIDMYVDDARRQTNAENRQTPLIKKLFQLLCCMTGKFLGNYFITLYLFTK